jgi:hypothetical protein
VTILFRSYSESIEDQEEEQVEGETEEPPNQEEDTDE